MDDAESLLPDGSRRDSLTDVQLLEEENGVNGQHIAGKLSTVENPL